MKKSLLFRFFLFFICIIALVGVCTSIFFYVQYQKAQHIITNSDNPAKKEAEQIVAKVSRLMLVPKDEQPTIATVSDAKKLKDQQFFKNAKNGDKVLIYQKTKTAIIYDPKADKIITVGALNLSSGEAPVRVALYNGTTTVGLTSTLEKQLKGKMKNITVTTKENAKKTDYTQTIVVDLTGKFPQAAAELATVLQGEVGKLPVEETRPTNTDLLVIIGKSP